MNKIKDVISIHYGHDATVVYIKNGEIVEAMSEERLSRQKKHIGFPHLSLEYIKNKYSLSKIEKAYLVGNSNSESSNIFYTLEDNIKIRKGQVKYTDYKMSLILTLPGLSNVLDVYHFLKRKIFEFKTGFLVSSYIKKVLPGTEITRLHHHSAHAWSSVAFIKNKHKKYLVFTLDGAGDNLSGTINIFENNKMTRLNSFSYKQSLGLVYSSIVDILGMSRNEHEFKVMGLAPYAKISQGEAVYAELQKIIWFDKNSMEIKSLIPTTKTTPYLITKNFHRYRFDALAYGVQKLTEEIIKSMVLAYVGKYNIKNIALGGGVFMNVKANQTLLEQKEVEDVVITPSSGDESLAIGSAIYGFINEGNSIDDFKTPSSLYLGSEYTEKEIGDALASYKFKNDIEIKIFNDPGEIEKVVAKLLSENKVVGRFKGRSEWGARALGNRSILANPSSRDNVKLINEMIKGRDFWMPFATSILYEDREKYLIDTKNFFAPYMSITFRTKPLAEKDLIAALHPYDLTSRPQMVTKDMNQSYHNLIMEYKNITGSSGILNTSFNLHGEPNVETPNDAIRTFDLSGLNYLAIGNHLVSKKNA
jgi:carbamoyltransferase